MSTLQSSETGYVMTGSLSPKLHLSEGSAQKICDDFSTFLHHKGYEKYDIRIGYRAPDNVWRILLILVRPLEEMTSLMELNDIHDEFSNYVLWTTTWFRWVDELTRCKELIPGWDEWEDGTLQPQRGVGVYWSGPKELSLWEKCS